MDKNLEYYMSLPYRVEVLPDQEEGGYALRCPELPGCVTCAENLEDGFRMLEDAKQAHAEDPNEQISFMVPGGILTIEI